MFVVWQSALAAACGGGAAEPAPSGSLSITALPLKSAYFAHDTVRLRATIGASGSPATGAVTWRSLAPSVATVDASGLVQGLTVGVATIEATMGSASGRIDLSFRGTEHRGAVSANEVWRASDSPHVVYGQILVGGPRHPTLTIEPGAEVRFRPDGILVVSDTLDASGTRSAVVIPPGEGTVQFVGDSAGSGTWSGLVVGGAARLELRQLQLAGCRDCLVAVPNDLDQGPELLIDGLTISGASGIGMVLGRFVTFSSGSRKLLLENGGSFPLSVPPDVVERIPQGTTFRGNAVQEVRVVAGTLTDSTTWNDLGVPLRVTEGVGVNGLRAPTLTIPPGALIRMGSLASFSIAGNGHGRLHVGSVAGAPVLIEPAFAGGTWAGIHVDEGGDSTTIANATLDGCETCLLADGSGLLPTRVYLDSVVIRRAVDVGVRLVANGRIGPGSRRVTITQSGSVPWRVPPDAASSIPVGTYTGNADDVVSLTLREVEQTATWREVGIPYRAPLGLAIGWPGSSAPVLTLAPGVRVEIGAAERIVVNSGALRAVGVAASPIHLTAIPGPVVSSWTGVEFSASSAVPTRLEHVEIDDAGREDSGLGGAVRLHDDFGGALRHVTIRRSPTCGVLLFSTLPWSEDYTDPALGNAFVDIARQPLCRFP